jgi:hypothetical protein
MNKIFWRFLVTGLFASLLVLGGCDDGDDGAPGPSGSAGAAGAAGADGAAGAAGADGPAGADGADGADGVGGASLPLPTLEGHNGDHGRVMAYDVQAAYNGDTFFWKVSYRGNEGKRHQYLRYNNGAWAKEGGDRRDAQATLDGDTDQGDMGQLSTIYEQRTTIMVSDPLRAESAPDFGKYGCFLTCHDDSRHMPKWNTAQGHDGKYIMPANAGGVEGDMGADLWHWRGARSNPVGKADDQWIKITDFPGGGGGNVLDDGSDNGGRKGDGGQSVFMNQSVTDGNPDYLLDPTSTFGDFTYSWDDFWATPFYYMVLPGAEQMGGTSPNPVALAWANVMGYTAVDGDTVPRRILRTGAGSRANINSLGTTFNPESADGSLGVWNVNMQRALDTTEVDDIAMAAGATYDVGFEVHLWEYTTRDHYVSFPQTVSLGVAGADIVAEDLALTGNGPAMGGDALPVWSAIATTRLYLFQPGINSFDFLSGANATNGEVYTDPVTTLVVDQVHGGAASVAAGGAACESCHAVRTADLTPAQFGGAMEAIADDRGGVWTDTPTD